MHYVYKKTGILIVRIINKNGIYSGIAIMPFLPFIVESEIQSIFEEVKKHDLKYILYKHLELKGDQKQIFYKRIKKFHIDILLCFRTNDLSRKIVDNCPVKNSGRCSYFRCSKTTNSNHLIVQIARTHYQSEIVTVDSF
jgi:DNA repair photolyase